MLPIICKGKGLIPRVGMIAPVLTPFKVDFQTLTVIIRTPGSFLKPYFVDPETLKETALTISNYKTVYDKYQQKPNTPKTAVTEDPGNKKADVNTSEKEVEAPKTNSVDTATDKPDEVVNKGQENNKLPDDKSDAIAEVDDNSEKLTLTPITKAANEDDEESETVGSVSETKEVVEAAPENVSKDNTDTNNKKSSVGPTTGNHNAGKYNNYNKRK